MEKSNEEEIVMGSPKYNRLVVSLIIGIIKFESYCIGLTMSTIRKESKISVDDMAEMIGLNRGSYRLYELGAIDKNFRGTEYYKKFLGITNTRSRGFDIRFFRIRKKKKIEFAKYIFGK